MTTAIVSLNGIHLAITCKRRPVELKNDFQIHIAVYPISPKGLKRFYFNKVDFKTEYEKEIPKWSKTNLLLHSRYANGNIPLTHLYNTSQIILLNHYAKNPFASKTVLRRCFFNFSQMNLSIFNSNMALKSDNTTKVKPTLVWCPEWDGVIYKIPSNMLESDYKTLDRYFESGIEVKSNI
jgi:hypothetical protein